MVSMRYSFRKNESNLSKKKMILYLIRDNRRISFKKKNIKQFIQVFCIEYRINIFIFRIKKNITRKYYT